MCGRLACTLSTGEIIKCCTTDQNKPDLKEITYITNHYDYGPFYNGPPTTVVPVLAWKSNFPSQITTETSDICLVPMRWGLIPNYKTDSSGTYHTHNARYENIMKSPMYKPCLMSGKRCVIVANGYYEWKTTEGENRKQPYYIYQNPKEKQHKSNNLLTNIQDNKYLVKLAGLFNVIREGNNVKYTCTIITTESDYSMSWMHHRMPIILDSYEEIENWLDSKIKSEDAFKNLPQYTKESPRKEEYELKYHLVDKSFVNNSSCNDPKCMEKISLKRKSTNTLDGWLKRAKK